MLSTWGFLVEESRNLWTDSRKCIPSFLFVCLLSFLPLPHPPSEIQVLLKSNRVPPAAALTAFTAQHFHSSLSLSTSSAREVTVAGTLDLQPPLRSSLPTFGYTYGCISGVLVCCAEAILFSYGCPISCKSKEEEKGMTHRGMILMSLSFDF